MKLEQTRVAGAPIEVEWYVTYKCNLACIHCCTSSSPRFSTQSDLTTEQALRLVEEMAALGILRVTLIGGEPFIRRDTPELIKAIHEQGMAVKVSTNGIFITPQVARLLKSVDAYVQVSLDGVGPDHEAIRGPGSFEKTLRGLTHLQDEGVKILLRASVGGLNRSGIHRLLEFAESRQLNVWLQAIWRDGRAVDFWDELRLNENEESEVRNLVESFRKTASIDISYGSYFNDQAIFPGGCSWGDNQLLVIAPNGTVGACQYSLTLSRLIPFPKWPENSLKQIVESHPYFTFRTHQGDPTMISSSPFDITQTFGAKACKVEVFKAIYGLPSANPALLPIFKREAEQCQTRSTPST